MRKEKPATPYNIDNQPQDKSCGWLFFYDKKSFALSKIIISFASRLITFF